MAKYNSDPTLRYRENRENRGNRAAEKHSRDLIIHRIFFSFQIPQSEDHWRQIARDFEVSWNFPHCIGCLDGKHVVMQNPENCGSMYLNYKGTFSTVLMAVCDANYCFTFADVGCQGRISDGGVFRETTFYKKMENKTLNLPPPEPLPGREVDLPFVLLADDAFALSENLLKPYPGLSLDRASRIFNYRLSRARRIIENTFGIMSSVFRVFRKPLLLNVENTKLVTLACCYLHNFLRKRKDSRNIYTPPGSFDCDRQDGTIAFGSWRTITEGDSGIINLRRIPRRAPQNAKNVRDEFRTYFMSREGQVSWQDACI